MKYLPEKRNISEKEEKSLPQCNSFNVIGFVYSAYPDFTVIFCTTKKPQISLSFQKW